MPTPTSNRKRSSAGGQSGNETSSNQKKSRSKKQKRSSPSDSAVGAKQQVSPRRAAKSPTNVNKSQTPGPAPSAKKQAAKNKQPNKTTSKRKKKGKPKAGGDPVQKQGASAITLEGAKTVTDELERIKRLMLVAEEDDVLPTTVDISHEEAESASHSPEVKRDVLFPKSPFEYDRSLEPIQPVRGFLSAIQSLVETEKSKSLSQERVNQEFHESVTAGETFLALPALDRQKDDNPDDSAQEEEEEESRFKGKWDTNMKDVKSGVIYLHNEIVAYTTHVSPSRTDVLARESIVNHLREVAREFWPDCSVRVFGSVATGLCLPDSDVDVVVIGVPSSAIHRLANALRARNLVDSLQKLDSANVPIIKTKFKSSPFNVDICFNQVSGLSTATFIKKMLDLMPEIKPLVLVVKHFLAQRDLNETYRGGMGSYLCFLSVVALCQRARRLEPTKPTNLGRLLLDYFDFYGNVFNYDDIGISLREGGKMFRKQDRRWFGSEKDRNALSFWLEDPMNPESNIGCKTYKISLVKHAFSVAFTALSSKSKEFDVDRNSDKSILATIIRLKPEDQLSMASGFRGTTTEFGDDDE